MILHTLNAGPGTIASEDCMRIAQASDAILLTGDGVYNALLNSTACLALIQTGSDIYLLEPDVRAAGILQRISDQGTLINYDTFVELTERFSRHLAWY